MKILYSRIQFLYFFLIFSVFVVPFVFNKRNLFSREVISKTLFLHLILTMSVFSIGFSQTSYQYFDLPQSAKMLGSTNGTAAVSSPELGPNPAVLESSGIHAGFSNLRYPADINGLHAYLTKKTRYHVISFNLSILDFGTLKDGQTGKIITANDVLVRFGLKGTLWNSLSCGLSLGYLHSKISNYSSDVLATNFGLRTRLLDKRLGLGISMENLGHVFSTYGETKEKLPTLIRLSTYYRPKHLPAIISLDAKHFLENDPQLIFAITLLPLHNLSLCISASSYKTEIEYGEFKEKLLSGISFGAGYELKKLKLDYALQNLGAAGMVTALSLGIRL